MPVREERNIHALLRLRSAKQEEILETSLDYKSGASFRGNLDGTKRVGKGVFVWPNGDRYVGEFMDNARSGHGLQEWADGSQYQGTFDRDLRHGTGEHTWADGQGYKGDFFRDRRHGNGTYTWPDGTSFTGTFYLDKKEGYGEFCFPNGNKFQGLYKNDERYGPGVLTYPNGRQDVGLWNKERLIRLCTPINEVFTMQEHPEFEYNPTLHIKDIEITEILSKLKHGSQDSELPTVQYLTVPLSTGVPTSLALTDTNSTGRDPAESIMLEFEEVITSDLDPSVEFEEQFFHNVLEKKLEDVSTVIKAENNTPSLIELQKHIYRHRLRQNTVTADIEAILKGDRGNFGRKGPLELASEDLIRGSTRGDFQLVYKLLQKGEVHVDVADRNGVTSLLGASVNCHQNVINCLLDNGADVNKLSDEGVSAIAACHIFYYPVDSFKFNIAEKGMKPPESEKEDATTEADTLSTGKRRDPRRRKKQQKTGIDETEAQLALEFEKALAKMEEREPLPGAPSKDLVTGDSAHVDSGIDLMSAEVTDEARSQQLKINLTPEFATYEGMSEEDNQSYDWRHAKENPSELDFHLENDVTSDFESNESLVNYKIEVTEQLIERTATALSMNDRVVSRLSKQRDNGTARQMAFAMSEHSIMEATIRLLLRRGADPNAAQVPMPAMFFAIKAADVGAVKRLLETHASTTAQLGPEKGGLAPLHIAAAIPGEEGVDITQLILKAGADPDMRAHEDGTEEDQDGKLSAIEGGRTPLHIACERDDNNWDARSVVRLLLEAGANPNLLCQGHSPLSLAIGSGNDLAIDELLEFGADPSLPLSHGVGSALCAASSIACEHRRPPHARIALIDKLIRAGANILAPIPIGPKKLQGTAVDYAYFAFNQDRRIAHTPYHALTHAERDTYNARRKLLAHLGELLREAAVAREREILEQDERDGRKSAGPSEKFVYTGAGASHPTLRSRGKVGFSTMATDSTGKEKPLVDRELDEDDETVTGIITVDVGQAAAMKGVKELAESMSRKAQSYVRKPVFKYCYECGRSVGVRLSACTRCKEVYYCSKACKLKAWNARHKEECVRIGGREGSPKSRGDRTRIDSPTPTTNPNPNSRVTVDQLMGKSLRNNATTKGAKNSQNKTKASRSTISSVTGSKLSDVGRKGLKLGSRGGLKSSETSSVSIKENYSFN
ncbi:ankyrin repeat and MYND domain-containing protein 1-like [Branchiostoma floridae x Branchiostoma japonicum]